MRIYEASDYAGVEGDGLRLYYGYEETKCPVESHKNKDDCDENDCEEREWCFVAEKNDVEVARYTHSELDEFANTDNDDSMWQYLLKGIVKYYTTPPANKEEHDH